MRSDINTTLSLYCSGSSGYRNCKTLESPDVRQGHTTLISGIIILGIELSLSCHPQSSNINMMIIFITAILGLQTTAEAWSFFRLPGESEASRTHICFSRSPKSHTSDFLTLPRSGNKIIPRVPHRSRGLEHKDDGRSKDWTFDQKRLRPLGLCILDVALRHLVRNYNCYPGLACLVGAGPPLKIKLQASHVLAILRGSFNDH